MVIKVVIPCPDLHKLIVHKKKENLKLKFKTLNSNVTGWVPLKFSSFYCALSDLVLVWLRNEIGLKS
jgi:hypothetical protein